MEMCDVKTYLIEDPDPNGPFGAKEVGQGHLLPVPPAVANAVYNAVGVRIDEVPITPEKVLKALREKSRGRDGRYGPDSDSHSRMARAFTCARLRLKAVTDAKCRAWLCILKIMKKYLPFAIIVIVLVAAVGGSFVLWKNRGGSTANSGSTFATTPPASNSPAPNQTPNDTAGLTRPNVKVSSPVIIEEFGDYQCPPCGQLYPELKQIETEYGDQVKIVFRHFPLMKMHKNALLAAHAAEAARNQKQVLGDARSAISKSKRMG